MEFILREIPRQRKSYKTVAEDAGYEHDLFYRWKEGKNLSVKLKTVVDILNTIGYELVPIPTGLTPSDGSEQE